MQKLVIYQQSTGKFWIDQEHVATGYSGKEEGRNNGKLQHKRSVGPIPIGVYLMSINGQAGKGFDSPTLYSIKLTPYGHKAEGRSGFYIHGDNVSSTASRGCPVVERGTRRRIIDEFSTTPWFVVIQ